MTYYIMLTTLQIAATVMCGITLYPLLENLIWRWSYLQQFLVTLGFCLLIAIISISAHWLILFRKSEMKVEE